MRNKEAGQALLTVTLSLTMLFGMIGLAVDLGWSYYRRQAAQTAAEAAAIGAAAATTTNSSITCSNAVCQSATACASNVSSPPATNVTSGCLYAKANGFVNAGKQTVLISSNLSSPPAVAGVSTLYWATATVTESNAQLFSGLLGGHTFGGVAAQATAGVFQGVTPTCVWVLDPHASQALFASGNGSQLTTGCGVYVNSNSSTAVVVNGQALIKAPLVSVVGSYQPCNNGQDCNYSPSFPQTNQPSVADPFIALPAPTYSGCNFSSNQNYNQGSFTINPGVYCNGITVGGNAQVTFNPGIYILNGGGLNINSANASARGSGVMFYNTANGNSYGPILMTGQSSINFSAPTSGTYSGVLFYQDRTITSSTTNRIEGTTNPILVGSLYFPTTPLYLTGGSANVPFQGKVVARTLTIDGNALFVSLSGPANGIGSGSKFAALIQ